MLGKEKKCVRKMSGDSPLIFREGPPRVAFSRLSGSLKQARLIIIIWLCLTRTGNYKIHEFDWLKSILTAV